MDPKRRPGTTRALAFIAAAALAMAALGGCASSGAATDNGVSANAAGTNPVAATVSAGAASAGALPTGAPPGGTPPGPPPGGAAPRMPGGGGTVDHGSYAAKAESDVTGATYTSTGDRENALRIQGKVTATLSGIKVDKSAGAARTGDSSNFYGSNAGVLALDGAEVTIEKSAVSSSADGGNGIFSYGAGTKVTVLDTVIRTTRNSSGGVMVAGGGSMSVKDADIDTKGASSAALRSDRGGGTLVVEGGTYSSHGYGSPAIYSTARVTVSDATLTATTSEAIVVEGRNSVSLKDCDVTGAMVRDNAENLPNVMIYQSMSGDAESGKSSFAMEGGSLVSRVGDMFYVTNTSCDLALSGVRLELANGVLLRVSGNDARNGWGTVGKNGGSCTFTASRQVLSGAIIVDGISSLALSLSDGSSLTGSINADGEGGEVGVSLDAGSSWTLGADSHVSSFSGSLDRVTTDGHKLYVAGKLVKG